MDSLDKDRKCLGDSWAIYLAENISTLEVRELAPEVSPGERNYLILWFFQYGLYTWELDHKEGWAPKNGYFLTMGLEKTLQSPLDCKEIKPVNPKGNQLWIFIGRTDAEVEAPIFWPPDEKSQFTGKDPDAGKDPRQKKREAEGEMIT